MGVRTKKKLYHGYVVFASTFILSVVSIGVFNASSLFLDPLKASFEEDPMALALMPFWITIQVVVGLASSMGGGPVQDWLADVAGMPMPVQFVVFGGGLTCLGFWLSSFASSIWLLLLGSVLLGIGIGFYGFISAGICVLWFDENRGTMLLLALSGRGLGSMFSSIIIAALLDFFEDSDGNDDDPWRPAMRAVGMACLLVGSVASMGMRLPEPGEVEDHESGPGGLFDEVTIVDGADDFVGKDDEVSGLLAKEDPQPQRNTIKAAQQRYGSFVSTAAAPPPRTSHFVRPSMAFSAQSKRSSVNVLSQMRSVRKISIRDAAGASILGGRRSMRTSMGGASSRPFPRSSILPTVLGGAPTGRGTRKSSVAEFSALAVAPVDFRGGGGAPSASPVGIGGFDFSTLVESDDDDDYEFSGGDEKNQEEQTVSFNDVLLSRTSLLLILWSLITSFAFLNLQVYVPGYVSNDLGLPSTVSGTAMTGFGLGLLLANLTLGPLTDLMGANPMLFWSMMGLVLMVFLWPHCTSALSIEAVTGIYGFLSSTNGTLPLIIVADAFNDVPPNFILMLNGVLNLTKCPGFLLGPTISALFGSGPNDYASIATVSWILLAVGNAFLVGIPSPDFDDEEELEEEDGEKIVLGGIIEEEEEKKE